MTNEKSPDGRFEILYHRRDDDSYMYSFSSYSWYVRSLETGDEIAAFHGDWNQMRDVDEKKGTQSVNFDGEAVVAMDVDGKVTRVELPSEIRRVEGNEAIRLTFRDGRTETRPRRSVTMITKYGEPFGPPLID